MKSKDNRIRNHTLLNKYRKPIVTILVALIVVSFLLIADVFNLPTKLGFDIKIINYDVWSIVLGNIIVVTIFIVTFMLFDKRNLEKDNLGKFAGAVILLDTYSQLESFLLILEAIIKSNDKNSQSENDINRAQSDYITNAPFSNDGKIFDLLQNGYIQKEQYQNYDEIMKKYKIIAFYATELKGSKKIIDTLLKDLKGQLDLEIKEIKTYKENL